MKPLSDNTRPGYVTLLAVTFAFGLATLGTALAVSVRSYVTSATLRERAIVDRISLESAAAQTLAQIATHGERPLSAEHWPTVKFNGREVGVEVSTPDTKIDLGMDKEGLTRQVVQALALDRNASNEAKSLVAWVRDAGVSSEQEDCLRRKATYGRAPEVLRVLSAGETSSTVIAAGDQADLRLSIKRPLDTSILWVRARFTEMQGEWALHDYRNLKLIRSLDCLVG